MTDTTTVRVLFFGPARDLAGVESVSLALAGSATVALLRERLVKEHPKLAAALERIRFAVNERYASDETRLREGDEVAIIPPVSGGESRNAMRLELVHDPIEVDSVLSFVQGQPAMGGIASFIGATRLEHDPLHGPLVRLEYEAYEPMALRCMQELLTRASSGWTIGRCAMVHRLGRVLPGQASVVVAVASPHRADAFDACRWLIDQLKIEVPIWKRDVYEDGFIRWVEQQVPASEGVEAPAIRIG